MKILLVNPPYTECVYSGWKSVVTLYPPLGLAYMAAVLEKNNIKVKILDANAMGLSIEETADRIINSKAEMVGLTATAIDIPMVYDISRIVKKNSDKIIVVGGPHVTFTPEETLKNCNDIDIVVRKEGEYTMLEIAKNPENLEGIKGITYRKNLGISTNPDRDVIKNIDELPYPARHILPLDLYKPGPTEDIGISGREFTTMLTSRGCPNRCTYCSSAHFWGSIRLRSPENILGEIEYLIKKYGIKEICFLDDNFTISRSRVEQICNLMIEKNLDIKWVCYSRVNIITDDLVKKMKSAGCFGLNFGIESGNQGILGGVKKNIDLNQVRRAIRYTKDNGLLTATSFMVGLPGDTKETVNQTIEFAIELNPDIALFCMTTPFPGTELYQEALQKGWIKEGFIWESTRIHGHTNFRNDDLSSEDIERLYLEAKKRFYMRWGYISQSLKRIFRDPKELRRYWNGAMYVITEGISEYKKSKQNYGTSGKLRD